MSFFGDIARGLIGAVQGFAGTTPTAAPPPVVVPRPIGPSPVPFPAPVGPDIPGMARTGLAILRRGMRRSLPHPGAIDPVTGVHVHMGRGGGRGNGQFARQTIVQTIELATGAIVRQEVFPGAPFLMSNEVSRLSTVSKKVLRAGRKIPRRVSKESETAKLKDIVLREAMRRITVPCPPSS